MGDTKDIKSTTGESLPLKPTTGLLLPEFSKPVDQHHFDIDFMNFMINSTNIHIVEDVIFGDITDNDYSKDLPLDLAGISAEDIRDDRTLDDQIKEFTDTKLVLASKGLAPRDTKEFNSILDNYQITSKNITKITLNCNYQLDEKEFTKHGITPIYGLAKHRLTLTIAPSDDTFSIREILMAIKLIYKSLSLGDCTQLDRKSPGGAIIDHHIKITQASYSKGKLSLEIEDNATLYVLVSYN